MNLEFYKPKNELLQKYIEGYYFFSQDAAVPLHYRTFPNNYVIVAVAQNISLLQRDGIIRVTPSNEENIYSNIVYRYTEPIEIFYQQPVNEITLYFKPLGLNHFIEDVSVFYSKTSAKEIEFNPYTDFKDEMKKILSTADRNQQIANLERYWLSKFKQQNLSIIEELIRGVEHDAKIDQLAKKHNISRQYLNKLFQKNIGKSPSEYRKVHRFRKAILEEKQVKSLTELSHNSLFYDQSHLIKDFHDLTGKNPSSFFKKVDTEKDNIWLML